MRKIEIVSPDAMPLQADYAAPRCRAEGPAQSQPASPPGLSIWMLRAQLAADTALRWDERHGDEALYVQSGELSVDGRTCPEGGAVILEANARPTVSAQVATQVIHMGSREDAPPADGLYGAPEPGGGQVHVVGPRGTFEAREEDRDTRFFADSTCPTCRLWLLYTARESASESPVHSHSQDELIHILRGEIRIGSLRAGPGASVFIAADQLYHFESGETGFAFLNYRRDASEMTVKPTGEKLLEAGLARGLIAVDDLR